MLRKRPYTQRKRAEQQRETRERIVEAAMRLHADPGPRNASISAVAREAGVQRPTVYRHFPDETALFEACTSEWLDRHPPPAIADWVDAADPETRSRRAVAALYRYYRETQAMWAAARRDRTEVPALEAPMAAFDAHLAAIADDLAASWGPTDAAAGRHRAALAVALDFDCWARLAEQGLDDDAAAALVVDWLRGLGRAAA